jgi:hypothetical protein
VPTNRPFFKELASESLTQNYWQRHGRLVEVASAISR